MRGLLNNRWIVGSLALSALISIGGTFNVFSAESVSPGRTLSTAVANAPATPEIQRQLSYAADLVAWPRAIPRDPFALASAYRELAAPPAPAPEQPLPLAPPVSAARRFQLQGVSMVPDNRMAVINRTMVAEGESIEGYRVVRILADSVLLDGPLGVEAIGFDGPAVGGEDADDDD